MSVTGRPGEALNRMANTSFDVILSDIRMPGMNGMEFYTHIVEKTPVLAKKFIFITGDVMGDDIKVFLSRNNLPYLTKPFSIESIKEKINAILAIRE